MDSGDNGAVARVEGCCEGDDARFILCRRVVGLLELTVVILLTAAGGVVTICFEAELRLTFVVLFKIGVAPLPGVCSIEPRLLETMRST